FGLHVLDFFCEEAWLNIELDGSQHGFPEQQRADAERDAWLESRGVKVLRFWNSRLRRERQPIRDAIWRTLQQRSPHPLPAYCRPMPIPGDSLSKSGSATSGSNADSGRHPLTLTLSPRRGD